MIFDMKKIKENFVKMYREHRGLFLFTIFFDLLAVAMAFYMFANLKPSGSVVKVSYSDLVGYKDGGWRELIIFPASELIAAVLFNLFIQKVLREKGKSLAKLILAIGFVLIFITLIMFVRLAGER